MSMESGGGEFWEIVSSHIEETAESCLLDDMHESEQADPGSGSRMWDEAAAIGKNMEEVHICRQGCVFSGPAEEAKGYCNRNYQDD